MNLIEAPDAASAWEASIKSLFDHGDTYTDQDSQTCKEQHDALIIIKNASDATALVTALRRTLPLAYPTIDELRAFVFSALPAAQEWSLGARIFGEPNQVDTYVIPLLRAHPTSRRAVVIPYRPRFDSQPEAKNPPAILTIQARIIDGALAISATLRSCDAFLGLPANIWQLRAIQEHIAHALGVQAGAITITCASLHWFEHYQPLTASTIQGTRRLLAANASIDAENKQTKKKAL